MLMPETNKPAMNPQQIQEHIDHFAVFADQATVAEKTCLAKNALSTGAYSIAQEHIEALNKWLASFLCLNILENKAPQVALIMQKFNTLGVRFNLSLLLRTIRLPEHIGESCDLRLKLFKNILDDPTRYANSETTQETINELQAFMIKDPISQPLNDTEFDDFIDPELLLTVPSDDETPPEQLLSDLWDPTLLITPPSDTGPDDWNPGLFATTPPGSPQNDNIYETILFFEGNSDEKETPKTNKRPISPEEHEATPACRQKY